MEDSTPQTPPRGSQQQQQQQQQHHFSPTASSPRFSCSICLDAVVEPVVTQCGHLYCWPCLYRWLEPGMLPGERQSLGVVAVVQGNPFLSSTTAAAAVDESRRVCPVCKAPCSVLTIVPIYALIERPPEEHATNPSANANVAAAAAAENNSKEQPVAVTTASTDEPPQSPQQQADANDDDSSSFPAGLRQRRTAANLEGTSTAAAASSDDSSNSAQQQAVPARPSASPPRPTASVARNTTANSSTSTAAAAPLITTTPLATAPRSSLGIASSFSPALQNHYYRNNNGNTVPPPLHYYYYQQQFSSQTAENHGTNIQISAGAQQQLDVPAASEYLSRILLLLGSFVILCLLLF